MLTLIYIHGFNSSSASLKGRLLQQAALKPNSHVKVVAPDLPFEPKSAMAILKKLVTEAKGEGQLLLVGSSMGGYYATYLANWSGCRAVLVNPAVRPYDLLNEYLGMQTNIYTGEQYVLTEAHMDQLKELEVETILHPERYLVMVQTGDEVMDYRQAIEKLKESPKIIIQGGDHGFQNFEEQIEQIFAFGKKANPSQV